MKIQENGGNGKECLLLNAVENEEAVEDFGPESIDLVRQISIRTFLCRNEPFNMPVVIYKVLGDSSVIERQTQRRPRLSWTGNGSRMWKRRPQCAHLRILRGISMPEMNMIGFKAQIKYIHET